MAEFLLRLRADSTGIQDLAGNTINENGTFTFTNAGKFGGKSITFDGSNYLSFNMLDGVNSDEDFTISFWMVNSSTYNVHAGILGNFNLGTLTDDNWNIIFSETIHNTIFSTPTINGEARIASFDTYTITDGLWHHYAITRYNGRIKLFVDGTVSTASNSGYNIAIDSDGSYLLDCKISNVLPIYIGRNFRYNGYVNGYLDDICIIKGKALWTENFTPPTDYLKGGSVYAYLSNNNLYTGTLLTNLTINWSGLTNTEKEALVKSFSEKIPSIQDLATISPFRVLTDNISLSNVKVTGQPKPQIIEPTSLINTGAVSTVQSINITNTITDAVVKFAITTDLSTYKVYDAIQGAWVSSIAP